MTEETLTLLRTRLTFVLGQSFLSSNLSPLKVISRFGFSKAAPSILRCEGDEETELGARREGVHESTLSWHKG